MGESENGVLELSGGSEEGETGRSGDFGSSALAVEPGFSRGKDSQGTSFGSFGLGPSPGVSGTASFLACHSLLIFSADDSSS